MKVIDTEIADCPDCENASSKLLVMDQIVHHFIPLFNKEIKEKQGQLERNLIDVKKLKTDISESKSKLQLLKTKSRDHLLKNKLLQEIKFLSSIDVIYGRNRQTVSDVLKNIDEMTGREIKDNFETLRNLVKNRKKD